MQKDFVERYYFYILFILVLIICFSLKNKKNNIEVFASQQQNQQQNQQHIKQKIIYILKTTTGLFNSESITYMIIYGTLLGWYRDNDVIDYDDDADMFCLKTEHKKIWELRHNLAGYGLKMIQDKRKNIIQIVSLTDSNKVGKDHGGSIDIYFLKSINRKTHDVWNKHIFDPVDLFPAKKINFLGMDMYAPNNSAKLVKKLYCDDFMIPQETKKGCCTCEVRDGYHIVY
jgi:hypothetical protein